MRMSRFIAGLSLSALLVFVGACTENSDTTAGRSSSTHTRESEPKDNSASPDTAATPSTAGAPNTAPTSLPAATDKLEPVAVGDDAELLPGVLLRITKVQNVELTGRGGGDSSGPGIAVYVAMDNTSSEKIDFSTLGVVAETPDGRPLSPSRSEPASVPTGSLAPGENATAVWTFHIDGSRAGTLIQASHPASPSIVQFRL